MQEFLKSEDFLETVVAGAEENNRVAREVVAGLAEEQLNWKPSPERWSIAQCLDHLAVTGKQFDSYFPLALEKGRQRWPVTTSVSYRPTFVGGWLLKFVTPTSTTRIPAPKVFRPAMSDVKEPLEKYLKQQDEFLKVVKAARGIDYNRTTLRSPVTPLMRYSIGDAFVVTVLHGQRHLAQARRVRETPGFPS